jgi:ABC-type glycerol-3-phosphate transport system substrate-binding protein
VVIQRSLALFLVAVLLSACQAADGGPVATPVRTTAPTVRPTRTPAPSANLTPTPRPVEGTVSIWHAWQGEELSALAQVIAEFNLLYPEVYFDVTYVPRTDLLPRFREAAAASRGPTLLLGPAEWGFELYQAGLLSPLDDLAAEASFLAAPNPAALQGAHAPDGSLIGLPYWIEGVVLYRNRGLVPDPAPTLGDMQDMAARATRGDTLGAVLERSFFFSGAHLLGLGGQILDSDGAPAFNNETGLAWLALVDSFEAIGSTEFQGDRDLNLFREGKAGFLIEGTWHLPELTSTLGEDNLAVDPWPRVEGGALSGFVRSENIFMNANAQAQARLAAWEFIEHFFSAPVQERWSDLGRLPAVNHNLPAQRLEREVLIALEGGAPYPSHPEFNQYLTTLDVALRSHLYEGVPATRALEAAEEALLQSISPPEAPAPTP